MNTESDPILDTIALVHSTTIDPIGLFVCLLAEEKSLLIIGAIGNMHKIKVERKKLPVH